MKKPIIVSIIEDLKYECNKYKDGDSTFIKRLVNKLENTLDEEKNEVFQFFLHELIHNDYDLWNIGLNTIVKMKEVELAPDIFSIYKKNHYLKDNDWKDKIIMSLMNLEYHEPKKVYVEYIHEYSQRKENWHYYDMLLLYYKLDKHEILPLLVDYFVNLISHKSAVPLEKTLVFTKLFNTLSMNNVKDLILRVFIQDFRIGNLMKELMIKYFHGDYATSFILKGEIEKYINMINTTRLP
jgi:hypothetical protein